jgi:hypothetical protein
MSVKDGVYWRSGTRIAARSRGQGSPKTAESAMGVGKNIAHMTEAAASRGHERSVAMTSPQDRTDVGRHHTPPEHTPRLRLKPKAPHTGYVDGAWWPHSDDLTTELPDLLAVLSVRLAPIDRVLYKLTDWAIAPAKLATGGRVVKLDGYRLQPPNTVEVLGLNGNRIILLVVPPHTDPDRAHATMMAAAAPDDDSTVDGLLMISLRDRESRTQRAAAQERWDSEGGAVR